MQKLVFWNDFSTTKHGQVTSTSSSSTVVQNTVKAYVKSIFGEDVSKSLELNYLAHPMQQYHLEMHR